jgi:hypothetical protein
MAEDRSFAGQGGALFPHQRQAQSFLDDFGKCRGERFPSVGCGESLRLQNEEIAGAALVCEETVIHLAAFRSDPREETTAETQRMAKLSERRRRFNSGRGD